MTGIWMSICSRLRQQGAQDASRKASTCQNEMEAARPPLGDGFLAVLRDVVFYPLLLHKRRQDRLVDRVVYARACASATIFSAQEGNAHPLQRAR